MRPDREPDPRAHLPDTLYDLAQHHARRAIREPRVADPLDEYDRTTSLGAAAEFLAKSTLAGISVTLLAGSSSTATLAEFGARQTAPKRGIGEPVTVGAVDAVKRLNQLAAISPALPQPDNLFATRNRAIHLGALPTPTDATAAQAELVTWVDVVLERRRALHQSGDWEAFWSPTYAEIATSILDETYEELRRVFDRAVQDAAAMYGSLVDDLEPEARQILIETLVHRAHSVDLYTQPYRCPACHNHTLHGLYELHRTVEVDDSDAPESVGYFVRETAELDFIHCPVCDLHLDRSLAGFTDVPLTRDHGDKNATSDEIEAWNDNQYEKHRIAFEHAEIGEPEEPDHS